MSFGALVLIVLAGYTIQHLFGNSSPKSRNAAQVVGFGLLAGFLVLLILFAAIASG